MGLSVVFAISLVTLGHDCLDEDFVESGADKLVFFTDTGFLKNSLHYFSSVFYIRMNTIN